MGALQYVDQPDYHALILRKTLPDLKLPGALMDRAQEWLGPTDAEPIKMDHKWVFPSGASLNFGYLEHEEDKRRYESAEFQYIAFDELTSFTKTQYTFLFGRLRRKAGSKIPVRMRTASNPGGKGHDWVYRRLVKGRGKNDRIFIPAKLHDNPHIDIKTYLRTLMHLDPLTRKRILEGDWEAKQEGTMFNTEWFEIVKALPANMSMLRYWDLAATRKTPTNDPAWTAGAKMGLHKDILYIADVRRIRGSPGDVQNFIKQTAALDGMKVDIVMEQEPASGGVNTIDTYAKLLAGYTFRPDKKKIDKIARAAPLASYAQAGNVKLLAGRWNEPCIEEAVGFPWGTYKDQVDCMSGGFAELTHGDNTGVLDYMEEEYEQMMADRKKNLKPGQKLEEDPDLDFDLDLEDDEPDEDLDAE